MTLDLSRLIGAVSRELTTRDHDGKPARVLTASRVYDTSREDLWDALTARERIPRWFLPISGDLRVGGRYQLEGNAGGEVTACDPPEHLAITWEMQGQPSWVSVRLTDAGAGKTLLRLEHVAHVPDDFWSQYGPGATGVGWELALLGLDRHVAGGGATVDPKAVEAWLASDEGKELIRRSSEGWGEASIAAGTEPAAARAAAERTTAFYTPQPEATPSGA